jgi:8-oxo-dGTP pyrophosphatase MutT (NUDIX family)
MQVRFDGYLGFAGGLVDSGEDLETAINRELHEEIGLDLNLFKMMPRHHLVSHLYETNNKNLVLHFYSLEVSQAKFNKIEKNVLNSIHYGIEVSLFYWSGGVISRLVHNLGAASDNRFWGSFSSNLDNAGGC